MRFVLTLLMLLTLTLAAEAQIFKRGNQYYSCQNGKCTPIAPPASPLVSTPEPKLGTKGVGEDFPTGVNQEAIEQGHSINGVKATKQEVISAVETALPELSKKWRVVLVGTTDQRKEALAKIGTKDSVVVNVFPPDHFYVRAMKPNTLITLMRPDGEVVADGGIGDIDKVMDFTKVGPFDLQPLKPDPTPQPDPAPTPPAPWYGTWIHWCCVAGGVLLTFLARYGFPLVRGFLVSKVGAAAEAEIEALVNAKLNAMGVKTVETPNGWK